ncbi:MAG: SPFH domain-containing protein [Acidobacteria bacterium]|nr:SPFH domain-containing protein [Acidobacteriota bacterium]
MNRETIRSTPRGLAALLVLAVLITGLATAMILVGKSTTIERSDKPGMIVPMAIALLLVGASASGLFTVGPNEAAVLQLFGSYVGTVRDQGLRLANPFYSKRKVSLRVRNFETQRLKVNDHEGNPIEIAAVVVWQVVDSAQALFDVDNFENYVTVQSEAALRNLATAYPYDSHEDHVKSLRGHTSAVAEHLKQEIEERAQKAGVNIVEARISHLAYAPEIATAMLQRQQAAAIIAARTRIVEGAVSMVEMALEQLSRRGVVALDEERKAAMVSNLLVVLCGERGAQPVVNAGTIYQ